MKNVLKSLLIKIFGLGILSKIRKLQFAYTWKQKKQRLKQRLNRAGSTTEFTYLTRDDLDKMHEVKKLVKGYKYDKASVDMRGLDRTKELFELAQVNLDRSAQDSLEVGARDGVVSYHLNDKHGLNACCLDLDPLPAEEVINSPVEFITGDVMNMPLDDNSFDLVFSYNSFEHFDDPEKALSEMIRVARPGGLIYLNFGPLYFSPLGYHLYKKISVPYCHLLFSEETLEQYCLDHDLGKLDFKLGHYLNGWTATQFRELWKNQKSKAEVIQLTEIPNFSGLKLIDQYPECFYNKTTDYDSFIISTIIVTLKKR